MKKIFSKLLVCMLVAALAVTSFIIPVSAAVEDDSSSVGVIYSDERYRSNDMRVACVKVKWPTGDTSYGTAFFFYKNALATAAHVIYNKERGGWAKTITVYPGGLNNKGYDAKIRDCNPLYTKSATGDFGKDWAILQINETPGYGYFGFSTSVSTKDTLIFTGHPGDKNLEQYSEKGNATDTRYDTVFYHNLSTTEGASGSPIYTKRNGSDMVVGIAVGEWKKNNVAAKVDDYLHSKMSEYQKKTEYRKHYYIVYDPNGGSGSMTPTTVDFGYGTELRKNTFTNSIETFVGWTANRASDNKWFYCNPNNREGENGWYLENAKDLPAGWVKYVYKDCAGVAKTSSVDNDVVTMYAQWKNYTVKYYADGGQGSMADTTVYYGLNWSLRTNSFTKDNSKFIGWTAYRRSDNKWCYKNPKTGNPEWYKNNPGNWEKYVYENQHLIKNLSNVHNDVVEMHAQWAPITYTIKYNANGGSGSMASTTVTYGVGTALSKNTFTYGSSKFLGWTAYRESDNKYFCKNPNTGQQAWYLRAQKPAGWIFDIFPDCTKVSKTSSIDNDTVTMYAQWGDPNYCTIYYDANGGNGKMDPTIINYSSVSGNLRKNSFNKDGYIFAGWTVNKIKSSRLNYWLYENPENPSEQKWAKEGKQPAGWTKYVYKDGDRFTANSSDDLYKITMYAQWVLKGDVNGDGTCNINDVTTLQRYLAKFTVENFNYTAADINGDGKISIEDVTTMQRSLANFG